MFRRLPLSVIAIVFIAAIAQEGKADCPKIPTVKWWGNNDHDFIKAYVHRKHGGNWDAYIFKWQRYEIRMLAALNNGRTVKVKKHNVKMKDAELGEYVQKIGRRLAVLRCLKEQEAQPDYSKEAEAHKPVPTKLKAMLESGEGASDAELAIQVPSVVVLPFNNIGGDPGQEAFIDGITEDIITDLSRLKDMRVIPRNTAFTYKGKPVNVQEVSRDLKVRYVLEGSVRKSGDSMRINARLFDADEKFQLWAQRYDRKLTDVFAVQDEITQQIVAVMAGYAVKQVKPSEMRERYEGVGTVIMVQTREGRVILDHEAIEGFMEAMVMSYNVVPSTLLQDLSRGDKIRFTIETKDRVISKVVHLRE